MNLPFFDQASSAQHIAELLADAEPPFSSLSILGERAQLLADDLTKLVTSLQVTSSEEPADVVLSFDVVHTLPSTKRAEYVKRIAALAKREAIIACPLGTDLQTSIYRSLANFAREQKLTLSAELSQAIAHGLPTPQDAAAWAHGFTDLDLFYAGDVAYFQDSATRFLFKQAQSPLRRTLLNLTSARAPSVTEIPLPPETVPMRRHRRLFLILRKR